MQPIGVLAVAVGVLSFVLIAAVSLRSARPRKRGYWRNGAFVPYPHSPHDGDHGDHNDFSVGV